LSGREQFALMGLALAAGGLTLGVAWLVGWDWVLDYGRLTLAIPAGVTAAVFYWLRSRRQPPPSPEEQVNSGDEYLVTFEVRADGDAPSEGARHRWTP
jgi:hypothetical protein